MRASVVALLGLAACATPRASSPVAVTAKATCDFATQPITLEVWPRASHGLGPGAPADFAAIGCHASDESGELKVACRAVAPAEYGPEERAFRDRAAQCFALGEHAPSAELLALVTDRVKAGFAADSGLSSLSAGNLPLGPHSFLSVRLDQIRLVVERESGGCDNANRAPDEPMCDPEIGEPTGRRIPSTWTYRIVRGPGGQALGVLSPWDDLFRAKRLDAFWIHIGRRGEVFEIDPVLAVTTGLSLPPPELILPRLDAFPLAGPPELRAALLADMALASFRLGDVEKGRKATEALAALVAAEPLNTRFLALEPTLRALEEVSSGRWLVADPCRARPGE